MILSEGKNIYPGHFFSFWEWSAPVLQTPEDVMNKAHELKLVGRVVKDIIAVGMGYNWCDNDIDDAVYNAIERMHPLLKAQIPNPEAFLPKGVNLLCFAEIDEPLLLVFEDGDVLGVWYDDGSCVRMDLNTISPDIEPATNRKNFHPARLFQDIIGKQITAVEVTGSTERPEFTGSLGLTLKEQPCYISKVDFVFGDMGSSRWLSFSSDMDYGLVEMKDYTGQTIGISAEKVPWIVEGYIPPNILNG